MRLILDSNVIFSVLIKDSLTRKMIMHLNAEFFVVSFSHQEIAKYKEVLMKKSRLGEKAFDLLLEQVLKRCVVIEDSVLLQCWNEAKSIMYAIDPKDTPFIAAALATGADIWSDDQHFLKQKKIKVWRTEDIAKLL